MVKIVIVVVVAVAFIAVVIKKATQKLNDLTRLVPKSIFLGDKYPRALLCCNLILTMILMSCNCFECVVAYL